MSLQGLSVRNVHRIERAVGARVLRATVNNAGDWRGWQFVTEDHRHGVYDRTSGEVDWVPEEKASWYHTSPMCEWLFGRGDAGPRPRGEWGTTCAEGHWHVA